MKDSAELAIISSHPTSGSEIFVLLKTSPICEKLKLNPIKIKRPKNLAVLTVFVEYGVINSSYPMMAKSMETQLNFIIQWSRFIRYLQAFVRPRSKSSYVTICLLMLWASFTCFLACTAGAPVITVVGSVQLQEPTPYYLNLTCPLDNEIHCSCYGWNHNTVHKLDQCFINSLLLK